MSRQLNSLRNICSGVRPYPRSTVCRVGAFWFSARATYKPAVNVEESQQKGGGCEEGQLLLPAEMRRG